jgi:hypothetical protein
VLAGHSHDFREQPELSEKEVMRQCRHHCAQVADCARFAVQFPARTCNLVGASAQRLVRYQSVSGPRACSATGAGKWQRKFEDSQGHQRSSTPTVGIPFLMPSTAVLAGIGAAAGAVGLLCAVGLCTRRRPQQRETVMAEGRQGRQPGRGASPLFKSWPFLRREDPSGSGASGGSGAPGPGRPLDYLYAPL